MPRKEWLKQGVNILDSLIKRSSTDLARIHVSDRMAASVCTERQHEHENDRAI